MKYKNWWLDNGKLSWSSFCMATSLLFFAVAVFFFFAPSMIKAYGMPYIYTDFEIVAVAIFYTAGALMTTLAVAVIMLIAEHQRYGNRRECERRPKDVEREAEHHHHGFQCRCR